MMHLVMNLLEGFYSYFTVEVGCKPLFIRKYFIILLLLLLLTIN